MPWATSNGLAASGTPPDPPGVSEVERAPDHVRPGAETERRLARPSNGRRGDGRPASSRRDRQALPRTPARTARLQRPPSSSESPVPHCRLRPRGVVRSAARGRALCDRCDSRATPAAVTAGDHRTVCSPQPAAADRRPRIRGVALPDGRISHGRRRRSRSAASRGCGVVPGDDVRLRDGRQRCASRTTRVSTEAREVAAGGFFTDAGRGT